MGFYDAFGNYFELLFQDMFPDVELVRSVQHELDEVIQDGIVNIVQLLRNSDSGVSSSVAKVKEDDAFEAQTRKIRSFKDWEAESKDKKGKGKSLTDRLVSDGLLTNKMVKDLHREFAKERKKSGKQKLIDDRE